MKNKTIKYFTQDEVKQIFKAIEKTKSKNNKYWLRDLTLFNIMYICWLRASELALLKLSHYNPKTSELYVERLKGSLNTTIRLSKEKKNLLNRYIRKYWITSPSEFLFMSRNHKPVSRDLLHHLIKKYGAMTTIQQELCHCHSFKHSIAIWLAESGANLQEIQHYLWHKALSSTLIYFQFTTAQQDNFYKKIQNCSSLA